MLSKSRVNRLLSTVLKQDNLCIDETSSVQPMLAPTKIKSNTVSRDTILNHLAGGKTIEETADFFRCSVCVIESIIGNPGHSEGIK
jgi:hypothetical protein